MSLLSDADLRALRGLQAANFPHTCRLESPTTVERTTGGSTTTWTPYASNIPCRLSAISGDDVPRGLALTPETNFRFDLPYGQPVAEKDRAVVAGETNGVQWEQTVGITYVATPKAFQSETTTYATDKVEQAGE